MSIVTKNVDASEVAKFDLIASRWWDEEGEFKPLHQINPLRLQFINDHTSLHDKYVIDIGCGGGILTESMARMGAHVTGIDASVNALEVARLHLLESKLTVQYQEITAEEMAEQYPACFDVVTCMELLEHVPDPKAVIKACAQLVKPGGKVFFSTLNRNMKSYLLAIIGAEYLLRLLPTGTHDYAKFIRPSELERWARSNQLQLDAMQGITYNPITKKYSLSSDIDVNYLICCHYPE